MRVYIVINKCQNFDDLQKIEAVFLNYSAATVFRNKREAEQTKFGCCNFTIDSWDVNEE